MLSRSPRTISSIAASPGSLPTATLCVVWFLLHGAVSLAVASPVFEKDVRPILKAHCFHCHGEEGEMKGGLDVRLARFIMKGGESGAAVIAGKPAESHLLEMIKSGEMPKGKKRLPDKDIATIEQWIATGAKTARPEPERLGPEHAFTDEERAWWAFQPIQRVSPPVSREANPIDAFIGAKLAEAKLDFSPEAEPQTLIRRMSFNLTGLPPTLEQVDTFMKAYAADKVAAVDALITRLLAFPQYGERWGRHWLDVAGYADSDGYTEKDMERKHAWKYRDYVIESLNADKPFDQFIREQLAGDEIAAKEGLSADAPTTEGRARYSELLRATGFLRMAPDGTAVTNDTVARNASIADTIKIVSTALYGMTIGCAQCHDHRYDAISQADYYRLRAVFEPGFDTKNWRLPASRLVSLITSGEKKQAAVIEAEAQKIVAVRLQKQEAFITEVLEKELLKRDEAIRDTLRAAYRAEVKKRTPEQIKLLKEHPSVQNLSASSLYLYDTTYKTKHADTLKRLDDEVAAVRAKKPVEEFVHAFTEVPVKPEAIPATFIFHRGEPDQPKDKVLPGDLSVLAGQRRVEVPERDATLKTSGRRLAYASTITDGTHPLLARVIVNRVWMQHFGRGLASHVGDFGALGERPTHPELLDWLASEFMRSGWSLKRLHHLILTSRVYQQSSRRNAAAESLDPDNRLLSRMNVRRLEAETLRDALLAVSGRLNTRAGGPSVPVMFNEEGQVVIGVDTTDTAGRQTGKFIPLNGEEFRRSVYVQVRRTRPLEMFATFDAPAMTDANCESRPVTTVSPQSLLLMNNGYMREAAQFFATRLISETAGVPNESRLESPGHTADTRAQIERAYRLCFGRQPSMSEIEGAHELVKEQTAHYQAQPAKLEHVTGPAEKEPAKPELLALTALCHALMSANEFLYVD
jgi:cytochrome c553